MAKVPIEAAERPKIGADLKRSRFDTATN